MVCPLGRVNTSDQPLTAVLLVMVRFETSPVFHDCTESVTRQPPGALVVGGAEVGGRVVGGWVVGGWVVGGAVVGTDVVGGGETDEPPSALKTVVRTGLAV